MTTTAVELPFGSGQRVLYQIPEEQQAYIHRRPDPVEDVTAETISAFQRLLDFPPLSQAMLPDDRVTIAVEDGTPAFADVVAGIVSVLGETGISPEHITVLTSGSEREPQDPTSRLPLGIRSTVQVVSHSPDDEELVGYLANTTSGERVYLSHTLLEAEVVISVTAARFDPLLGHGGSHSAFYPAMSDRAALNRFVGQTHAELGPDDVRPLRQLVDEVGWLLGNQLAVQVIPAGNGTVCSVIAGMADAVQKSGAESLRDHWQVTRPERVDLVVTAVDGSADVVNWNDIGRAIEAAAALVAEDGRIVLLSELVAPPGDGISMLIESLEPTEALRPLRESLPADVLPATSIAKAVERARLFLLSGLPQEQVEDIFLLPLDGAETVQRLIDQAESSVFLPSASLVYAEIQQ